MKLTDADFNLGVAVAAVQALPEGVYLCMSGRIYDLEIATQSDSSPPCQHHRPLTGL